MKQLTVTTRKRTNLPKSGWYIKKKMYQIWLNSPTKQPLSSPRKKELKFKNKKTDKPPNVHATCTNNMWPVCKKNSSRSKNNCKDRKGTAIVASNSWTKITHHFSTQQNQPYTYTPISPAPSKNSPPSQPKSIKFRLRNTLSLSPSYVGYNLKSNCPLWNLCYLFAW